MDDTQIVKPIDDPRDKFMFMLLERINRLEDQQFEMQKTINLYQSFIDLYEKELKISFKMGVDFCFHINLEPTYVDMDKTSFLKLIASKLKSVINLRRCKVQTFVFTNCEVFMRIITRDQHSLEYVKSMVGKELKFIGTIGACVSHPQEYVHDQQDGTIYTYDVE